MTGDDLCVEKRDSKIESFNFDKLLASITKAGMDIKIAQEITSRVRDWAIINSSNHKITSLQIRDAVERELKENYPVEADSYRIFKR